MLLYDQKFCAKFERYTTGGRQVVGIDRVLHRVRGGLNHYGDLIIGNIIIHSVRARSIQYWSDCILNGDVGSFR